MPPKLNLVNKKFGLLTVLSEASRNKVGGILWLCRCECEDQTLVEVTTNSLNSGHTKSCGCLRKKLFTRLSHGMSRTLIYQRWENIIQRMTNENYPKYQPYGGSFYIDPKWFKFEGFYEDMGTTFQPNLSIDRIDNNKGYYKENCRWITQKEQLGNRNNTIKYVYKDELRPLTEIWEELKELNINNIPYSTFKNRVHDYGWNFMYAISTPIKPWNKKS